MAVDSGFYWDETFVCSTAATLQSNQYFIVASTAITSGLPGVALCVSSTAGANGFLGVLQNDPDNDPQQAAIVRLAGISKVSATTTASIAINAPVTCTTGGQAMTADTTGQLVFGKALTASTGATGTVISALIRPHMFFGSTA